MINDWIKINETMINPGYRPLLRRTYRLPDGRVDDFDIKKEGPTVCILALTTEQQVILTRQYRPGPEKILLELPGGAVDQGESPETAARRELLEETGYAGDLQFIGTSLECAYSTRQRHNFVATNCHPVQAPQPDQSEFIEVTEMPIADFRTHLREGQLTDIETGYLGLDFLGLL